MENPEKMHFSKELFERRCCTTNTLSGERKQSGSCTKCGHEIFYAAIAITIGKLDKVLGIPSGELIEEISDDIKERGKSKKSMEATSLFFHSTKIIFYTTFALNIY
jgi:hypothetical protein